MVLTAKLTAYREHRTRGAVAGGDSHAPRPSGQMQTPLLAEGWQHNGCRRKRLSRRLILQRDLTSTFDPVAMPLDELPQHAFAGTRGRDHFDPAVPIDTRAQAPSTAGASDDELSTVLLQRRQQ